MTTQKSMELCSEAFALITNNLRLRLFFFSTAKGDFFFYLKISQNLLELNDYQWYSESRLINQPQKKKVGETLTSFRTRKFSFFWKFFFLPRRISLTLHTLCKWKLCNGSFGMSRTKATWKKFLLIVTSHSANKNDYRYWGKRNLDFNSTLKKK